MSRMPRYVRALTFVPWLIVAMLLVIVATRVGVAFFAAMLGLCVAGSLVFVLVLARRSRRSSNR